MSWPRALGSALRFAWADDCRFRALPSSKFHIYLGTDSSKFHSYMRLASKLKVSPLRWAQKVLSFTSTLGADNSKVSPLL